MGEYEDLTMSESVSSFNMGNAAGSVFSAGGHSHSLGSEYDEHDLSEVTPTQARGFDDSNGPLDSANIGAVGNSTGSDRPFKCKLEGCGKEYKNPNGLKYHMRHGHGVDTGNPELDNMINKPYQCVIEECGKRYKNLNGLKYHIQHATLAMHLDPRSPLLAASPQRDLDQFANLEDQFCKDFSCCGIALDSMHDLLQHFEEFHVLVESDCEDEDDYEDDDEYEQFPFDIDDNMDMDEFDIVSAQQQQEFNTAFLRAQIASMANVTPAIEATPGANAPMAFADPRFVLQQQQLQQQFQQQQQQNEQQQEEQQQ
ncbi:hypothetical protein HDU81_001144, partial [Chytriomyces hyalinus]